MAGYKYRMELSWSERDLLWIVFVPELPGCFADSETPAHAIANAQEVIGLWIEPAPEDGRDIPEPQHE